MFDFDPDAAARPDAGVFGLPHSQDDAALVLVPVPFDATTSYRDGTRCGPDAIAEASLQVDLFDLQFGKVWERGIFLQEPDSQIVELARSARRTAEPILQKGGAEAGDEDLVKQVDAASAEVTRVVRERTLAILQEGKIPGVVGGDHSCPLGAMQAIGEQGEFGVLHLDAHADLRVAFEGFRESHASIFHNALSEIPNLRHLVQVGIRDFGERELEAIRESEGRVRTFFDLEWRRRLGDGDRLSAVCEDVVSSLPERVWISFDIDGLDPSLCPNTGTPVPGGLQFHEACLLLEALTNSGRRIVGFDLCEVAPGDDGDSIDANVGARILYKLCCAALITN